MSFRIALLENLCLFKEHIDPPGKLCLFDEQIDLPGKIHVCSKNKCTLLENFKKVAPGKKEQTMRKQRLLENSHVFDRLMKKYDFLENYYVFEKKNTQGFLKNGKWHFWTNR